MIIKNFLLPLVYLGNGHYGGQTPPNFVDTSMSGGEKVLAFFIIAIIVIVVGRKIYKIL